MRVRCDVVGVSVGRRSAGVWSPVGSGFRAILNSGLSLFARRDASCRLFAMMIGYPASLRTGAPGPEPPRDP
ncbi:hypothetical protein GEV33_012542 [Tenebrio molitor]|uniref:Uncharacterized protein n=1 Tax=Tenebrio molitor TaxID=7067 RepID=A0A8J6L905_TENMO|nr:hypothetical protein GEV33_012542 [Tenebrio molitor]